MEDEHSQEIIAEEVAPIDDDEDDDDMNFFFDKGEIKDTNQMQAMDTFQDLLVIKANLIAGENAYTKFKIDEFIPEERAADKPIVAKKAKRKVYVEVGSSQLPSDDGSSYHSSPRDGSGGKETVVQKIIDPIKEQEEQERQLEMRIVDMQIHDLVKVKIS